MSTSAAVRRAVRGTLARIARRAPVRVFAIIGPDAPDAVHEFRLAQGIALLDSPRSANVLLVAGSLPESLHESAARVHDQLSHPRGVVWWTDATVTPAPPDAALPFRDTLRVGPSDDVPATVRQLQQDLTDGRRASSAAILPDVDPAPWRGVGPYGQGGTGMTGGVPYGRPLADRAEDRDGLMLDQLPVRVGPFFPPFPPGLVLDVALQGDVIQNVTIAPNGYTAIPATRVAAADPFTLALTRPVLVAAAELARARHHLRWLAHALRVHGLDALGQRTLALAVTLAREGVGAAPRVGAALATLARLLDRTRALDWAMTGVGTTPRALVADAGLGPVARAAGIAEDARLQEPAYRALGFAPLILRDAAGDARARWAQRLAETAQSLELASRAGNREAWGDGVVETPRGRRTADGSPAPLLALVPSLLRDQEWGDAVATVVSLDLDVAGPPIDAPAAVAT